MKSKLIRPGPVAVGVQLQSKYKHKKTPSGYINAIPGNIKRQVQWLSQNVRLVAVAISIHTPSGNIKNSPGNINLYVHWLCQNSSHKFNLNNVQKVICANALGKND